MITALLRHWFNRHDPGLEIEAFRFGVKPVNGVYDYQKAQAGSRKAKRQSETGRVWPKPKPVVTPVERRREIHVMPRRKDSA